MKNILLSINSKYVKKIINRDKLYEFRGWIYKKKVKFIYIYSSGIDKKIVGRFIPKDIFNDIPINIWEEFAINSDITKKDFFNYVESFNYKQIFAISIDNLEILKKPLKLCDISDNLKAPQRFKYLSDKESKIIGAYFDE